MPTGGLFDPSSLASSLLERVRRREPDAWGRLVRLYGPLVYRWARQCELQSADAADTVQEVFRAVWTHIDRFRRDRPQDSFRGWLWVITRNAVRDHFRRQATQPGATGGSDALARLHQHAEVPDADADVPRTETSLLHRALELIRAEFEVRTWQAFCRTVIDGCSTSEVADELQMSRAAVRQARSRILRRLREELGDAG